MRKPRAITAALTVTAGALLAAGASMAPAGATVTSTAKTATSTAKTSAAAVVPQTLKDCPTGTNNTYEYWVECNGTGPTSYRTIADCSDGEVVMGILRWDGDTRMSYASCHSNGQNATLGNDWGILLCSNSNGSGTYQGYSNRHGDISQFFQAWGSGNITTGGNWACDYDVSGTPEVSPSQPQLRTAAVPSTASK